MTEKQRDGEIMSVVTAIEDLAEWLPPAEPGPADLGRLRERLARCSPRQLVRLRQLLHNALTLIEE